MLDEGPLEAARAAAIVSGIAAALDAAHAAGLVHRDVKPANVLLAEAPDGSEHVYLADFGISKPLQTEASTDATMAAAGLGLVTAVIAAVVAVLVVGGSDDMSVSQVPTVATSPPGAVGKQPVSVAVGEVRVWVASLGSNEVDRLRKGRPEKYSTPITLKSPRALAVGFESIWVVNDSA